MSRRTAALLLGGGVPGAVGGFLLATCPNEILNRHSSNRFKNPPNPIELLAAAVAVLAPCAVAGLWAVRSTNQSADVSVSRTTEADEARGLGAPDFAWASAIALGAGLPGIAFVTLLLRSMRASPSLRRFVLPSTHLDARAALGVIAGLFLFALAGRALRPDERTPSWLEQALVALTASLVGFCVAVLVNIGPGRV